MQTNIRSVVRRAVLLLSVAALFLVVPALLRAQIPDCPCDKIPLTVQKDVACDVTFLLHHPSGVDERVTVQHGTTVNIPCEVGLSIDVEQCGNSWLPVPVGGCLININTATTPVCCVDVCLERGASLCWGLIVRPTISAQITCPCR
ncbi:MAG: hypothetical protein JST22_03045 [Bacteroidetes bacterium]|nr:hypothetical protein [Bacteroidota bacterium]